MVEPLVTVSFAVFGDKQVERDLLRMSDNARDLIPAYRKMHESFLNIERRQFDTDGASGSGGWAPLKPATIRRKVSRGQDATHILRAADVLRRSLVNATAPGHIARMEVGSFFFGTSDEKAPFHQHGTRRMPQRKVVELTETQRRAWVRIIQKHLVDAPDDGSDLNA